MNSLTRIKILVGFLVVEIIVTACSTIVWNHPPPPVIVENVQAALTPDKKDPSIISDSKAISEQSKEQNLSLADNKLTVTNSIIEDLNNNSQIDYITATKKDIQRDDVALFINKYTGTYRGWFRNSLENFDRVRPVMESVFVKRGLPKELVYLAFVESGGRATALSPMGAAGYWQFLSGTARKYGLDVNKWVDERRDLEKSTNAAATYLLKLYDIFDDWLLAIAAYNAGEGAVFKITSSRDIRSFWEISSRSGIKHETMCFVPKYLAVLEICKNREKYGFEETDYGRPVYDILMVPPLTNLNKVAKVTGSSEKYIRSLNSELIRNVTPPSTEYEIKLPYGMSDTLLASLPDIKASSSEIADLKTAHVRVLKTKSLKHTVHKGETLYSIAKRYKVSEKVLAKQNKISNPKIISPGAVLKIPRKS